MRFDATLTHVSFAAGVMGFQFFRLSSWWGSSRQGLCSMHNRIQTETELASDPAWGPCTLRALQEVMTSLRLIPSDADPVMGRLLRLHACCRSTAVPQSEFQFPLLPPSPVYISGGTSMYQVIHPCAEQATPRPTDSICLSRVEAAFAAEKQQTAQLATAWMSQ